MSEQLTHWKKLNNPNYLGTYALEPGKDMVLTIQSVREETVIGADGKKEQCMVMRFRENVKPMILNTTNAKTIQKLTGTPYVERWAGHKIQIYSAEVKAFGEVVDALRIRPFAPQQETYKCSDCGQEITPAANMTAQQVAEHTHKTYARTLCAACGAKAKQAAQAAKQEGDVLSQ